MNGLFTEKMKMADLALANYRLLYVFPRFGLPLGWGENTVKQVCGAYNIPISLFLPVCNLYTHEDYCPDSESLALIPLDDLMKYLKNSHADYLERRLPEVIAGILLLVADGRMKHGELLKTFCEKYRHEVVTHFEYEEQTVFPYISSLLDGRRTARYQIKEYQANHSNLDAALGDLKNIILKYLPPECSAEQSLEALVRLFTFEWDMAKHTQLEEQILIALVERIENRWL
jgi:regulator of cell morphogenesis and NO signaling